MSSFRSEDMRLVQLFIQNDAAHETLVELGAIGAIHFKDLNPGKTAFQRTFVNQVRQCDEMERILRFINEQIKDAGVSTRHAGLHEGLDAHLKMDELAGKLEELEKELLQNVTYNETLVRQFADVVELQLILQRCGKFFTGTRGAAGGVRGSDASTVSTALLEEELGTTSGRLSFIAGLIPSEKLELFGRVLFRSTRGNMVLRSEHLDRKIRDSKSGEMVAKAVFIVFFSGERVQQKIARISDTFGATRHPFPERSQDQNQMLIEVETRIHDLNSVLESTRDQRYTLLSRVAMSIDPWFDMVRRNKAIYHTMNMFNYDITHKCLIAEGWCPNSDLNTVNAALRRAQETSGALVPTILNVIPTRETPPTFFRSSKFTSAFQEIIDAYGMARYQEYNPAVFSIITFPFLFGVMFGDVGHGLIMSMVAAYLCINEVKLSKQKLGEMVNTVYQGRYLVLLMGIFAMYCGSIYNETFSIMNQAAKSAWEDPLGKDTQKIHKDDVVYPWGVDPGWAHTGNKLNYYNSLKMKMSILFGVTQMVAGICCKLANSLFFNDMLTLLFVFVPEIIFINCIFGYLCICIFLKWSTNYNEMFILNNSLLVHIDVAPAAITVATHAGDQVVNEGNAYLVPSLKDALIYNASTCFNNNKCSLYKQPVPSLLDMLIKMFMSPGNVPATTQLYPGQGSIQLALLLIAFASVPVLLLARPLILKRRHDAMKYSTVSHADEEEFEEEEEHFDFGEIMVHQIIHTIEYVLGCISNTASYLRLWALSLAHAQLSEVFWERLVVAALKMNNIFFIFVAVGAWATATFGVLMLMESLSAFLHALRLHWVEFMSKFYGGDGYKYVPFDFAKLPKGAETGAEGAEE